MSGLSDRAPRSQRAPQRSSRSRALLISAGIVVVGFIALTGLSSFLTERMWFSSLGYSTVFSRLVWTKVLLFVVFGGLMAVAVGVNILMAFRLRPALRPSGAERTSLDQYREAVTPIRRWLLLGVSLLTGAFAGTSGAGQW